GRTRGREPIEAGLRARDTLPVPAPGADYGRHVWQQIAPRLPERPEAWWQAWFQPRRLAVIGALAALIVAAFVAGRITKPGSGKDNIASTEQARERIVTVAGARRLGQS